MRFLIIIFLGTTFLSAQTQLPIQHKQIVLLTNDYLIIENGQETRFPLRSDADLETLKSHCSQFPEAKALFDEINMEVSRKVKGGKRLKYTIFALLGTSLAQFYFYSKTLNTISVVVLVGGIIYNRKTIKQMIQENLLIKASWRDKTEMALFRCNQAYQQQSP